MNDQSSRSHLIFTVQIEAHCQVNGEPKVQRGKISFVDLAGSERSSKSNPTGNKDRQAEANNINSSLSTLGRVIHNLTTKNAGQPPYRDSLLTRLM